MSAFPRLVQLKDVATISTTRNWPKLPKTIPNTDVLIGVEYVYNDTYTLNAMGIAASEENDMVIFRENSYMYHSIGWFDTANPIKVNDIITWPSSYPNRRFYPGYPGTQRHTDASKNPANGNCIQISPNKRLLAIGAPGATAGYTNEGEIHIFHISKGDVGFGRYEDYNNKILVETNIPPYDSFGKGDQFPDLGGGGVYQGYGQDIALSNNYVIGCLIEWSAYNADPNTGKIGGTQTNYHAGFTIKRSLSANGWEHDWKNQTQSRSYAPTGYYTSHNTAISASDQYYNAHAFRPIIDATTQETFAPTGADISADQQWIALGCSNWPDIETTGGSSDFDNIAGYPGKIAILKDTDNDFFFNRTVSGSVVSTYGMVLVDNIISGSGHHQIGRKVKWNNDASKLFVLTGEWAGGNTPTDWQTTRVLDNVYGNNRGLIRIYNNNDGVLSLSQIIEPELLIEDQSAYRSGWNGTIGSPCQGFQVNDIHVSKSGYLIVFGSSPKLDQGSRFANAVTAGAETTSDKHYIDIYIPSESGYVLYSTDVVTAKRCGVNLDVEKKNLWVLYGNLSDETELYAKAKAFKIQIE